jgi:hypothetical protein
MLQEGSEAREGKSGEEGGCYVLVGTWELDVSQGVCYGFKERVNGITWGTRRL